ncbi:MAG TPA: hypothetical protein VEJ18_14340 [Planctomycetota bacterium]|nr:hypothetical protein [Planctomycetota bacterium]
MRIRWSRGLALALLAACATGGPGGEAVRVTLELFEFDAGHGRAIELALAGGESAVQIPGGVTAALWRPGFQVSYRTESVNFPSRRTSVQSIRIADGQEGLLQMVEHDSVRFDVPVPGGAGVVLTGAGLALRPRRGADGAIDLELTPWFQVRRGPTLRAPDRAARFSVPAGWAVVVAAWDRSEPLAQALLLAQTPRGPRRTVAVVVAR